MSASRNHGHFDAAIIHSIRTWRFHFGLKTSAILLLKKNARNKMPFQWKADVIFRDMFLQASHDQALSFYGSMSEALHT